MSAQFLEFIKAWEGFRAEAYPDPGSKDGKPWTIGYGQTKIGRNRVKQGDTISESDAADWLRQKLFQINVELANDGDLNGLKPHEIDAVMAFVYNIGPNAWQQSSARRYLLAGHKSSFLIEHARWIYNDGKVMKGLIKRRRAEAKIFTRADYSGRP